MHGMFFSMACPPNPAHKMYGQGHRCQHDATGECVRDLTCLLWPAPFQHTRIRGQGVPSPMSAIYTTPPPWERRRHLGLFPPLDALSAASADVCAYRCFRLDGASGLFGPLVARSGPDRTGLARSRYWPVRLQIFGPKFTRFGPVFDRSDRADRSTLAAVHRHRGQRRHHALAGKIRALRVRRPGPDVLLQRGRAPP